jgi:hypothetical protein
MGENNSKDVEDPDAAQEWLREILKKGNVMR